MNLTQLQSTLDRARGKRDMLRERKDQLEQELVALASRKQALDKAREIVSVVAQETQAELVLHVSDTVSSALDAVFNVDRYSFRMDIQKRANNASEVDLLLETPEGETIEAMEGAGGGVVDVVSFALRVAMWSIADKRSDPVLIADEPFRHLSGDLQEKAGKMLSELCRKLGLQIIIVTHERELIEAADVVFEVTQDRKGNSVVEREER